MFGNNYGMKRFAFRVQPLNPNRFSQGGRESTEYNTLDQHDRVVEARNKFEAERQIQAMYGGSNNVRLGFLGEA